MKKHIGGSTKPATRGAYAEGMRARLCGLSIRNNPYDRRRDIRFDQWRAGWNAGRPRY